MFKGNRLTKAKSLLISWLSAFSTPVLARGGGADKMFEEPTTKVEELAAAFGDVGPVLALCAITLCGLAMIFNKLPTKWGAMIIAGSTIIGIAGLIADFVYG